MFPSPGLSSCVLSALSAALQAVGPASAAGPTAGSGELGTAALFSWADYDGDSRLDLAAVTSEGRLQLLADTGGERFEDTTESAGLSGVENAALALWADYDGDGRLDLFVGAREGASRLFRNEGGWFVDMTAASGLALEGAVLSAHWLDHDGDGRLDLHAVTAEQNRLFRGLAGGFFAAAELPLPPGALPAGTPVERPGTGATDSLAPPPGTPSGGPSDRNQPGGINPSPAPAGGPPAITAPAARGTALTAAACATSIEDQASLGTCLSASTTPTLGMLYPLSSNLFVAVGGEVGIGTTLPAARLHVAGTARITDTLTLVPSVDKALDVLVGSIYKNGALFIHTKGAVNNTALGSEALMFVTTGHYNTATGNNALRGNSTGSSNTANGFTALGANQTGFNNTATGAQALGSNLTGNNNTAAGFQALEGNTTGIWNTALGANALQLNMTGYNNTASGFRALQYNMIGTHNTASGAHALTLNSSGNYNAALGASSLTNNTTGSSNTATGFLALAFNTTGDSNTASGAYSLLNNTVGIRNTAVGVDALRANSDGTWNSAFGAQALTSNTTGHSNTACGPSALDSNTTGSGNTACGNFALSSITTGGGNIAIGDFAGADLTGNSNIAIANRGLPSENGTIRIGESGKHKRAFIAGIRSVTTGVANAVPVLVDSKGQLGTVSSSRRFKEEIRDMGELSERLLELRPVVFRYKPEVQAGERPLEYGLIAEEVALVFPELVVYDDEGKPLTVKYHLLSSMLLNELQKVGSEVDLLRARLDALEGLAAPAATEAVTAAAR